MPSPIITSPHNIQLFSCKKLAKQENNEIKSVKSDFFLDLSYSAFANTGVIMIS